MRSFVKMDRGYILNTFHPAVMLAYFLSVIVLGVCIPIPEFIVMNLFFAILSDILLNGRRALRMIFGLFVLCAVMSLLSPFFNPLGNSVLFTYLGGRPYTIEAIAYGASVACMFSSMIIWFQVMSNVIDTDRSTWVFSSIFPKLGLVVSSAMGLLSRFIKRLASLREISSGDPSASIMVKAKNAADNMQNLLQWSFYEGIDRADTMRARGFGTGKRTSYRHYAFTFRSVALSVGIVVLVGAVVSSMILAKASMSYFPSLSHSPYDANIVIAIISYGVLLAFPAASMVGGWLRWRSCISKI